MKYLIVLVVIHNAIALSPNRPIVINDIVNCVFDLIETNFLKPGLLVFPNSNNVSSIVAAVRNEVLEKIHKINKYSVRITGPDNKTICSGNVRTGYKVLHVDPFKIMAIAKYFVIIVDDYNDFTYLARKIVRSRSWNPYAKFIIYLHRNLNRYDLEIRREVENIFNCLFSYNVINVVVIIPQMKNARQGIVYSWRPYDPPHHCGYYNETAKNRLLEEGVCDRGIVEKSANIFKGRIPTNMQGCILHILALERKPFISKYEKDPNIERKLIRRVLANLNISIKVEIIDGFRGERDEKGKWGGALGQLVDRKGEILLGGIFPDFDVHEDFECSSTYLVDSYTWVVPRAYPSPPWSSLTAVFDKTVWFTAAVVFIVCVFIWKTLGKHSGDTNYNKTYRHCFLNLWVTLLGFPAYMHPNKGSLRIFNMFFILYCILFVTAYQTKLIDVLQNPTFSSQIKTVQELLQSGLKFGGIEELRDLFHNSSDPFELTIGMRWINVHNMSKALVDVVVHRNFSVLCSRLELAHHSAVLQDLSDSYGENNYYAFETSTFVVPLEMIALKGFPFMKAITRTLNLYKQLGLNEFARRYFATFNKRKRAKLLLSLNVKRNHYNPLSMQHLLCGFFILVVGMSSAAVILILEIVLHKILQRRNADRQYFYKLYS